MNEDPTPKKLDLNAINEKLKGKKGPSYWRGLEEVAETEEFQQFIEDEFPNRRDIANLDRRTFLKFMGASIALAGVSGCRGMFLPVEKLVPYVIQPEEMVPGVPLYYSTTLPFMGYGFGVLCSQREGRPIKLEGNPTHPTSLGAINAIVEAEVLTFYDPDRLSNVLQGSNVSTWEQFAAESRKAMAEQAAKKGAGLRFLTGTITSPTLASQMADIQKQYPQSKWYSFDPLANDGEKKGSVLAFGKQYETRYDLTKAKVILSLDSDFLLKLPDSVRLQREWADGRRITGTTGTMNRVYSVTSAMTTTAATADHYFPVKPSDVHKVAAAIAAGLGVGSVPASCPLSAAIINGIVKDLQANPGAALVMAGEGQGPDLHALCFAINEKLGAIGQTVLIQEPVDYNSAPRVDQISALTAELKAGTVDSIFILGGNPVYDSPADLDFADALSKAKFKAYLSYYQTETSEYCDWTAPMSHPLESWGDLRSADGTISLIQPLIEPLYDSWSVYEFLSALTGPKADGYDILRDHYKSGPHKMDDDRFKESLYHGLIKNTTQPTLTPKVLPTAVTVPPPAGDGIEVRFQACGKIGDGSLANNGWLRELPDQITRVTWDNVIEISPAMAVRMNISSGNMLKLATKVGSIQGPAWVQPGQADGSVTLTLGYGRTAGGVVATAEDAGGYNCYPIRSTDAMGFLSGAQGVSMTNQGGDYRFANVQTHSAIEGRDILKVGTLEDLAKGEQGFKFPDEEDFNYDELNMYPKDVFRWDGPQWGMTIDLTTCTGCGACMTACQAENNVPVVGKDQVARAREMHWLRVDRYYGKRDDLSNANYEQANYLENPTVIFQPVMCVHCEKAPCEPVCPVAATVHSHDGLNQMVYNRCIGTRYCSDNCPYKVRRFNFLNYQYSQPNFDEVDRIPLLKLLSNPEVTVRSRGVMEKCTYCVQRISFARIEAKKAGLPIRDGEILTACQQACPTKTITFGNIADPKAAVTKLKSDPRSYKLLEELNTRPRTSHMARLRNPNPEILA